MNKILLLATCTLFAFSCSPKYLTYEQFGAKGDGETDDFAAIVEGKDCTPEQAEVKELFSGVIVFDSKALFELLPQLGCSNVQHEYYVTEVPEMMVRRGMKVETYFTKDGDDLRGINTPEDLEACERILRQRTFTVRQRVSVQTIPSASSISTTDLKKR